VRTFAQALLPWAGLVAGIASAAFVHQFGSEGMFDGCPGASPVPLVIVALAGLVICTIAGLASWLSVRSDLGARRIVGIISAGSAAVFAMAIVLPVVAALLLPPCFG
jgi:hypothetical protein